MLTQTYTDAYLKSRVTDDIENRAIEEVDAIRAFPAAPVDWRSKLIVLRAYILTCLEHTAAADDVFAVKLGAYRKEWYATVSQAVLAADAAAMAADDGAVPSSLLSITLERG